MLPKHDIGEHPVFGGCKTISWRENNKTFRYYTGDADIAEPIKWQIGFGAKPHWAEPPHYVGEGLDIILEGQEEHILSIRPRFRQYGIRGITCCMHNDYSKIIDLSGIGYTSDSFANRPTPITDERAIEEARTVFNLKSLKAKLVLHSLKDRTTSSPPPDIGLYLR
ncbi:hypothetical protein HYX19_02520 [Candidatus Woesearchaeota archaeon]|nr:hypothetical protein [Candidatus Woesearchaeota archaeon]